MNFQFLFTRMNKLIQVLQSPRLLRALLFQRVLAGAEHRANLTADLETVVDIGANRGQFALAVRRWSPKARVIAFEPLTKATASFRKVLGDSKVTLHQAAIGPEAGMTVLHVAGADDSSSLLPISSLQVSLFPGTAEVRTEKVPVGPLSDFVSAGDIKAPALLKLDVQGFELETLLGCEDLLECFAYVYAECSFVELYTGQALADEVVAWLRERNFVLKGVYNMSYDKSGGAVQGDFLFSNNSKPILEK